MTKKEYVEFGEEWKKEMKKLNKDQIIEMFKERCQRVQFLECRLRKLRQTPAFSNVIGSAYKAGYEQRVIDQLQGASDGNLVGSHYKEEKLNELADKYVSKH